MGLRDLSLTCEGGPLAGVPASFHLEGGFHSANTHCLLMGVPTPHILSPFLLAKAPLSCFNGALRAFF